MLVNIILVIIVLVVALSAGAIFKNGVPLVDKPGPLERLAVYLTRNTAQTRPDHQWPELRVRTYPLPPAEMFARVRRAATGLGWRVVEENKSKLEIHAVASTPWLGFKDDVRLRLEQAADGGSALHVSSSSRVGRADYGANIGRIMALHRALKPSEG